jgi:cell division control protein 24
MKKWAQQIEAQRRRYRERTRNSDGSRAGGTSQTEFEFMRNQPNLENPYARPGEDDEEDDSETLVGSNAPSWVGPGQPYGNGHSDFSQSRNASSTSLRSRSTASAYAIRLIHRSTSAFFEDQEFASFSIPSGALW